MELVESKYLQALKEECYPHKIDVVIPQDYLSEYIVLIDLPLFRPKPCQRCIRPRGGGEAT